MVYFLPKCFVLGLFLKSASASACAYLTGSINTSQSHTEYWYHVGEQIQLDCHVRCVQDGWNLNKLIWWRLEDKDGAQRLDYDVLPGRQYKYGLSRGMSMTLVKSHNFFLLTCNYGEVGVDKMQLITEITQMNVRFLLNTSSTSGAMYTAIANSINTNNTYSEHQYKAGERLCLDCYALNHLPYEFSSVIEWSVADVDGRDETIILRQNNQLSGDGSRSKKLCMKLTEEFHGWTLKCTHSATSRNRHQLETLMVHLLLEQQITRDSKTVYIVVGSIVATVFLTCILLYLICRKLREGKNTPYLTHELDRRPLETFTPEQPYGEVIVDNENYDSGYTDTGNGEATYCNTLEQCYAEVNPYATVRLEPVVCHTSKHIYMKPTHNVTKNTGPQPTEATSRYEMKENEKIENDYVNTHSKYTDNVQSDANNYQNLVPSVDYYAKIAPKILRNKRHVGDNVGYCKANFNRKNEDDMKSNGKTLRE